MDRANIHQGGKLKLKTGITIEGESFPVNTPVRATNVWDGNKFAAEVGKHIVYLSPDIVDPA